MAGVKAELKAAVKAIQAGDYADVLKHACAALEADAACYDAHLCVDWVGGGPSEGPTSTTCVLRASSRALPVTAGHCRALPADGAGLPNQCFRVGRFLDS